MQTPFEALGEPARRELLDLLRVRGPSAVNDLVAETGLSQPSVSRHLRVLREAGLVSVTTAGQRRIYELELEGLAEVAIWLTPYVVVRQQPARTSDS
jgi:DNA-binding transcriptional ArsR family regulator